MTDLLITCVTGGTFMSNAYIVGCPTTKKGVIIDTGEDGSGILDAVEEMGLDIERILLTHAHIDHIGGLKAIKQGLDVPAAMHPDDQMLLDYAPQAAQMFGMHLDPPPQPEEELQEGQVIQVGELSFDVLHCPGHAPGHVVFTTPGHCFCADVLFSGSIGRTDLPGGDYDTLITSIKTKLFPFPDDTICYPGHGPATTIGREKAFNPFLQ